MSPARAVSSLLALLVGSATAFRLAAPRRATVLHRGAVAPRLAVATAEPEVRTDIRNIAIVAHVDHGKTTLVDAMLESAQAINGGKGALDTLLDNNDQERERGITILAKNAALTHEGVKVNIVDTPGHADFGGEVERVLNMVDGVLLLVDAQEGPKPQTRFVLKKALALGHRVLVVINKIDKPAARPEYVVDKTFDLFCELGASDEQTDFPIVYTSAINRVAGTDPATIGTTMASLMDEILKLPKPKARLEDPLQLQISNIGSDPFIGRLGIGRIRAGTLRKNSPIGLSAGPDQPVRSVKVSDLFQFEGMGRAPLEEASAGEIVVFAGVADFNIGDTLVDPEQPMPLEPIEVEEPTMTMTFGVNKSPFGGRVGKLLTSRNIRDRCAPPPPPPPPRARAAPRPSLTHPTPDRLTKELEVNVALRVADVEGSDELLVSGRGLLHLTVRRDHGLHSISARFAHDGAHFSGRCSSRPCGERASS